MRPQLSLCLFAALIGAPSIAAPVLDYQVPDQCPDSGRFSDEVAARLGAIPFSDVGEPFVVRIGEAGDELLGTLELGEGSRMVRGTSCEEVFEDLVAATAVLLDEAAPVISVGGLGVSDETAQMILDSNALGALTIPDPEKATVEIKTSKPEVIIAEIVGRGSGYGSSSSGSVTVSSVYYEDLCKAPCTLTLDPGLVELTAYGPGYTAVSDKLQLSAGQTMEIQAEPGSGAKAIGGLMLASLGLTGVITGGTFLAIDGETEVIGKRENYMAVTLGSAAVTGLGFWMGRSARGTFEITKEF